MIMKRRKHITYDSRKAVPAIGANLPPSSGFTFSISSDFQKKLNLEPSNRDCLPMAQPTKLVVDLQHKGLNLFRRYRKPKADDPNDPEWTDWVFNF